MICPNKAVSYSESLFATLPIIISSIKYTPVSVSRLYKKMSGYFQDSYAFMLALDVLYVLDAIDFDKQNGVVSYVSSNIL